MPWAKGLDAFSSEAQGTNVIVDGAGDVAVAGDFANGKADFGGGPIGDGTNPQLFVARYKDDGTFLWAKAFANPQSGGPSFGIAGNAAGALSMFGNFSGTIDLGGGVQLTNQATGNMPSDLFAVGLDPSGNVTWSRTFHSSTSDTAFGSSAMDAAGNTYITGAFGGVLDLGNGVTLTSAGFEDAFVAELDPTGKALWGKAFGDASNDQYATSIAVDAHGDIVVAGNFFGSISLGGQTFTAGGTGLDRDVFLAKLDASGHHLWSKHFTGFAPATGGFSYGNTYHVAVDPTGNVILSGGFEGTVDFGGGPLSSAGGTMGFGASTDVYVAKFDPTGAPLWSKRFGDTQEQTGTASADAAGNVLLAVTGWGTIDFGTGTLTSAGQDDIFLAKLSPTGTALWSKQYGGNQPDFATGIAGAGSSAFYAVGDLSDTVDFGSGPLTFTGNGFFYVARIDAP
jgi:hypothetical protein